LLFGEETPEGAQFKEAAVKTRRLLFCPLRVIVRLAREQAGRGSQLHSLRHSAFNIQRHRS